MLPAESRSYVSMFVVALLALVVGAYVGPALLPKEPFRCPLVPPNPATGTLSVTCPRCTYCFRVRAPERPYEPYLPSSPNGALPETGALPKADSPRTGPAPQ